MDNKYILCGSDEMNIRMWKARSAEKLGVVRRYAAVSGALNIALCVTEYL
jgi:hypothetical protein